MNRKHLIALSIFAAMGSNAAFANEGADGYLREYGIDLKPVATSNAPVVSSGTAAATSVRPANGVDRDADYLRKYGIDLRPAKSAVSREEVLAELQIWREAGLDQLERGETGADGHSVAHQRAVAKYAELRNSPQFAERVEQIARQRGKPVVVVAR